MQEPSALQSMTQVKSSRQPPVHEVGQMKASGGEASMTGTTGASGVPRAASGRSRAPTVQ